MPLDCAGTCPINGSFKQHRKPTYIDIFNELRFSSRVTVKEGITWALHKYILKFLHGLDREWLSGLTYQAFFLPVKPIKFPLKCSTYKIPSYHMALREILGHIVWVLVLRTFMRYNFCDSSFGKFSELPGDSGRTGTCIAPGHWIFKTAMWSFFI